jgi:hypothetical protein
MNQSQKSYAVSAWALRSPAAPHEDRVPLFVATVRAADEESARRIAAKLHNLPADYWEGPRASAAAVRYATRYRRGTKGERVPEVVTVGHAPYVILRCETAPKVPFNAPHMGLRGAP